jgi:hypothetical protein
MKSSLGKLAPLCIFGILLFALWTNVDAYAQNRTAAAVNITSSSSYSSSSPSKPSSFSSQQHISKVKITSPIKGQQLGCAMIFVQKEGSGYCDKVGRF